MSTRLKSQGEQLGFDALLAHAEAANLTRQIERETAHLPGTMEGALPFHRALIERHHAAMLAADIEKAMELREEAHRLATKLNNFEPGILADEDSPGNVLEQRTRAKPGHVPLWGQAGSFEISVKDMRVRIEMDGLFGICACSTTWMGFSAHAVELDRPFLSETGYRSFLGIHAEPVPGLTTDAFAQAVIAAYVARELKGKLLAIAPEHRERRAKKAGKARSRDGRPKKPPPRRRA